MQPVFKTLLHTMRILTNIHKICIVKVKAPNLSENGRTSANIVIAEPNILLYKPQQYILYTEQQHYPNPNKFAAAASTSISQR